MSPSRSPHLTRFLSDFTLGFSDGLTVPFALTAGLSSLGRADTVIYAGLAELCAGSISMGIGGYLAALDELPSPTTSPSASPSTRDGPNASTDNEDDEEQGMLLRDTPEGSSDGRRSRGSIDEKGSQDRAERIILRYLAPLTLPDSAVAEILNSLRHRAGGMKSAACGIESHCDSTTTYTLPQTSTLPVWPVASGVSISLGYVVGGIIPLTPYLFASTVGVGLKWSIGMCLVALMVFGSGKSWLLAGEGKLKKCFWAGVQMLLLGSLAASAAVLCVSLLGASTSSTSG